MRYLGIDPGLDGALAALDRDGNYLSVVDTPSLEMKSGKGKRRQYNVPEMVRLFCEAAGTGRWSLTIEQVHAMPGQGVSSMFSMGRGLGTWEGIAYALATISGKGRVVFLHPASWKKIMLEGLDRGSKDASLYRASQLFPSADLRLKKHDGRAEALLLAEAGRRANAAPIAVLPGEEA